MISLLLLVGAGLTYLLELNPVPGVFFMMLGGPALPGILIDAALVAMIFEACTGRLPFVFVAIPIIAVGIYFGWYSAEMAALERKNAALRLTNPTLVVKFDPKRDSLVLGNFMYSSSIEGGPWYKVPVSYRPFGNDYRARRLLKYEQCQHVPRERSNAFSSRVHAPDGSWNLCELITTSEAPPLEQLIVKRTPSKADANGDIAETVELSKGGQTLATFHVLHTHRPSRFPLLVAGCSLSDMPSAWACMVGPYQTGVSIDGFGIAPDGSENMRPEATMLGLQRYTDDELNDFKGPPDNQIPGYDPAYTHPCHLVRQENCNK